MYRSEMIIPNLPQFWLWPNIGEFIVNLHWIIVLDEMARSDLALDALDDSDTPNLGCGAEERWWFQKASDDNLPEFLNHVRIILKERFTQDQGAQPQVLSRPKNMINLIMLSIIRSM